MSRTISFRGTMTVAAWCAFAGLAPAGPAVAAPASPIPVPVPVAAAPAPAVAGSLGTGSAVTGSAVATRVPAVRIVLERSGGFAGGTASFVVDRSTTGGRQPLRAAGSSEFRRLRGAYQPANPCCDRFLYRITVTYRNGRSKTVSTVQGTAAPSVLWKVIGGVERVGARTTVRKLLT